MNLERQLAQKQERQAGTSLKKGSSQPEMFPMEKMHELEII